MRQSTGFRLTVSHDSGDQLSAFLKQLSRISWVDYSFKDLLYGEGRDRVKHLKGLTACKALGEYDYMTAALRRLAQAGIHKAVLLTFKKDGGSKDPTRFAKRSEWVIEPATDGECLDWFALASVYASVLEDLRILWIPEYESFLMASEWFSCIFDEYFFQKEGAFLPKAVLPEKADGICMTERDGPAFGITDWGSDTDPCSLGFPMFNVLRIYGLKRVEDMPGFLLSIGTPRKLEANDSIGIDGQPIWDFVCQGLAKKLYVWAMATDKGRTRLAKVFELGSNGLPDVTLRDEIFDRHGSHEAFMYLGGALPNPSSMIEDLWKLSAGQMEIDKATEDAALVFFSFDTAKGVIVFLDGNSSFFDLGKAPHPRTQG